MITLSLNLNLPLANCNSQIKPPSSNLYLARISSQSAAVLPVPAFANSKSRLKSSKLGPRISCQLQVACPQPPVVVPIADVAHPKIVSIARFDPQPIVPVVLPIPVIDAFPKRFSVSPKDLFTLHNKLMLQPHQQLLLNHSPISTTHHPNLYQHPFCFVGHGSYLLAGFCHNLVLVCFYELDRSCPREALWNLDTNELKFLPEPDFPRSLNYHCRTTYTFIKSYGFGFDPLSKDYKVLRFVQFVFEDHSISYGSEMIELYSLKSDSWKRVVANSSLRNVIPYAIPSVHINGFFFWLAIVREDFRMGQWPIVLSFDFASEKLSDIPVPTSMLDFVDKLGVHYELVEFEGSLAAVLHSKLGSGSSEPFSFEIWVWSGNEWARRVPAIDVPATTDTIATVVGLFENDKLFLQSSKKELLLFDCATRELENLGIYDDPKRLWFHTEK